MLREKILFADEVYAIIGAAIEVHRQLKSGFLEAVYQEAMEVELAERGIPFRPQEPLAIFYKGRLLQKHYIADLVCYDKILVELKVVERMGSKEEAQLLNYLHATRMRLGLLINFADPGRLDWKRLIL